MSLDKQKTHSFEYVFLAERAGSTSYPKGNMIPSMGTRDRKTKTRSFQNVFCQRRGRDSNPRLVLPSTHLAGEPIQPLWHLPISIVNCRFWIGDPRLVIVIYNHQSPIVNRKSCGGSGIRTHVGVTQTCFQDMRLQPLGHPSMGFRLLSEADAILP